VPSTDEPVSLRVAAADLGDLAAIREFIRAAATALDAEGETVPDLVVAVDEAATNIIRHGYRDRRGPIEVEVERSGPSIVVRVRDQAPPFDPTTWPAPDLGLPLERRRAGGLGIHLLRRSVDRVVHRRSESGNELTLMKAG